MFFELKLRCNPGNFQQIQTSPYEVAAARQKKKETMLLFAGWFFFFSNYLSVGMNGGTRHEFNPFPGRGLVNNIRR